ncbi:hypothetical protein [Shewanella sp. WE21]|jgi:hypothetical protein|uniref:hypothetical protein n=1 Tax=Shewanella sp. WE21 TaxID=2029986 RepID=UPI0020B1615F|nr:hypothetical protein [Shewanella sp. WE21]
MVDVKTKLLNAFEALKKEGKKISPYAVEKRAGVANGSCKNHPAILEMILDEKARYHPNPTVAKKGESKQKKQVDKERYDDLEESNKRLRAESGQFRNESHGNFRSPVNMGVAPLQNINKTALY